jgi:zinc transporter ZupT
MVFFIGIATTISTFVGGWFALRFKDKLHLILGFSAGAVIGVAFFDLLPEAISLGTGRFDVRTLTSVVALGFLVFMLLDRFIRAPGHDHSDEHINADESAGRLGAGSLSIHSFLDGLAIGLAFKVSAAVGVVVAIAVLVHDFSDGINTVNLVLKNAGSSKQARNWLIVDALAPIAGIASTFFFNIPEAWLGIVLAVFSGFFLHIGASDLLPESFHRHPTRWTTFATLLGAATLYIAIQIAG